MSVSFFVYTVSLTRVLFVFVCRSVCVGHDQQYHAVYLRRQRPLQCHQGEMIIVHATVSTP